jgi:protein-S-isoprenylcysteine O-methyltransferase Ste14
MNTRLMRLALALYPAPWRDRYGQEVVELTRELVREGDMSPMRAVIDLMAGAATERCRALARSRTAALVSTASIVGGTGIAAAAIRTRHSGGPMRPYFQTHAIGVLLLVGVILWFVIEFIEFLRVSEWRDRRQGAPRVRSVTSWIVAGAVVIAANIWLYLAPRIVPAAAIRPAALAFGIGMAIFVAGVAVRAWSFSALGEYFSYSIRVSPDHTVVTTGPYRVMRHPSYAGGLLIYIGIGIAAANWVSFAAMTVLPFLAIAWRIHLEEHALSTALGDKYRSYAAGHKRLVPLVW